MNEIFQKLKVPLILVAVLFGGFIVYNAFIKQAPASSTLLQKNMTATSTASSPERDLLPLLLKIQNVTLDEKLFLDPIFRALVDFSQPIVPEKSGKANPFAGELFGVNNPSLESLGFVDGSSTTVIIPKSTVKKSTTSGKTLIKK